MKTLKTRVWLNFLLVVSACLAASAGTSYDWTDLSRSGRIEKGEVVAAEGRTFLRIVNTNGSPIQFPLLKIENPPISRKRYVVRGEIKYENVAGQSYLEMWNCFAGRTPNDPEQKYFTRTLGSEGDMAMISGSSDWRRFALPFDSTGAPSKPTRLEINLVLLGSGTVSIGALQLEDLTGEGFGEVRTTAWWSSQTGGWIGGIGGTLLGSLGSVLTWCASKGKAREFVLSTSKILIALGALTAAIAVIAIAMRQPFWVWYVPALMGVLLLLIMPGRYRIYQKTYAERELRRMQAVDLGAASPG